METEFTNNRRKGHVARLPKVLRDKVNAMLDDGATYPQIVAELKKSTNPPLPHSVNEDNIGNWQKGGYQDYLRNQTWADTIRGTQDKVLEAAAEDPVKFADAGVQLAATRICEQLAELSHLQSSDEKASDRYARIANSMARLAKTILIYEQHRRLLAKEKAAELPQLDPDREFNDNEHRLIVDRVNRLFGLGQYRRPEVEAAFSGMMAVRHNPKPKVSAPPIVLETPSIRPVPEPPKTQTNIELPATNATGAPVSNPPSQISNLKSEIPSPSAPQPVEPPPTQTNIALPATNASEAPVPTPPSQISNLKSEIPSQTEPPAPTPLPPSPIMANYPYDTRPDSENDQLPDDWQRLSDAYIAEWQRQNGRKQWNPHTAPKSPSTTNSPSP